MEGKVEELKESWKAFVMGLMNAKDAWEELKALEVDQKLLEHLPVNWQMVLNTVLFGSSFEDGLYLLISYWRLNGGLEVLWVDDDDEKGED